MSAIWPWAQLADRQAAYKDLFRNMLEPEELKELRAAWLTGDAGAQ
jgi:hypothetical protein